MPISSQTNHTRKVKDEEEAIKVTKKKNLENDIVDETLEIDEIVNIKESKNHPLENVIGNLNQRTLRSQAQNQSNFFCFISTIEPKNVNEALGDESWIVAMQEELNQFIANDVWELVPQPRNMKIIGTKWTCVDEFSKIMHDEFEMSMMGELNFFLGLQIKQMEDGIFFNQSKYIKEMLKKFGLEDSKLMKTPMSSDTKLTKDEECESVDSTKYRGMIGSLLYLTASRPDIMLVLCLCAASSKAPKTSHIEAVKHIFQYVKCATHLGLWYPKRTDIETIVYANSDHAGDYVDRKSTSGFIQVVTVEGLQSGVEFCFDNACVDESRKALRVLDICGEKKKDFQRITLKGSLPETVAKVYNILHDVVAIKKLKIQEEEVSAPSSLTMERKR
ncbi:retrovirus-related pol polyprotein from transposon TNT 1-94 [Tanacetum coccineum]